MGPVGVWIGLMLGLLAASILFLHRFNKQSGKLIEKNSK
jgi:Na+-driven multidrug efflux pump